MSWLPLQTVAQILGERVLNALPEGFLIAIFAWALLRVLRRQNSGTRFAVWFLALLTVAVLPVLGGFGAGQGLTAGMSSVMARGNSWRSLRPAITISGRWALLVFLAWALGAGVAMVLAARATQQERLTVHCGKAALRPWKCATNTMCCTGCGRSRTPPP